jgi:RNA polymerase sigma-70 factor (ECF subfamily)
MTAGPGTMEDERRLLRAMARRQPAAWSEMYDRHVREVFGFVHHLLGGDGPLAEELHQEVWLKALEGFARFDPRRGSFRDWLFGIARHQVSRHYRRLSRDLAARNGASEPVDEIDAGALPAAQLMEGTERASVIRAALLRLSRDHRDVLLGKYRDGLTVREIADRAGRTPKAVESLLSRAREQLRTLLLPYFQTSTRGECHVPPESRHPGGG